MKAIMVYTSPLHRFDEETKVLVRLQIDNHKLYDWEDVLLFTNFEYEYGGVKATVVPDLWVDWDKESNKMLVINYLLYNKLISGEFWYHDFDAYQNNPFDLILTKDLSIATYTYKDEWNCGSFFFKDTASDIFNTLSIRIFDRVRPRADEKVLTKLTNNENIKDERYEKLNGTYNLTKRFVNNVLPKCDKPIKILHFHPYDSDYQTKQPNLEVFTPLMSDNLKELFNKYGIK